MAFPLYFSTLLCARNLNSNIDRIARIPEYAKEYDMRKLYFRTTQKSTRVTYSVNSLIRDAFLSRFQLTQLLTLFVQPLMRLFFFLLIIEALVESAFETTACIESCGTR